MKVSRTGAMSLGLLVVTAASPLAVLSVFAQDKPAQTAAAPSPETLLADSRLTVHTLLREDIFAGFLAGDMKRFARGEKDIELLLEQRPGQKANLLAWKGGATLYRAVIAHEAHRADEFKRYYRAAQDLFAEAGKLTSGNEAVHPVTGGSYLLFADRLPKENRKEAWAQAYSSYQALWKQQSAVIDKLPPHFRGELLAGLAQSAQRTGHAEEAAQYLDKLAASLPGTPYETAAKSWKADPAAGKKLACVSCHEAGRLADRLGALEKK